MEIVENGNCGEWKLWKIKLWKMEFEETSGKWELWKIAIVENGNCGK